jgi:flagellar biosynthetic protein FliR
MDTLLPNFVWGFIVIFSRIGSLITALPGLSENFIFSRFRLSLALGISIGLIPILSSYIPPLPESLLTIFLILLKEIIIGIFFGCIVRIIIAATHFAGTILAMQSAFSSATMFDPAQGSQNAIIGNFYSISAITLVFVSDIHHLIIEAIIDSFHTFQINSVFFTFDMSEFVIGTLTKSFIIGVKVASPYLVIGALINITSGVIARMMPNMQIFFIITPLQILICLLILNITFLSSLEWYLEQTAYMVKNFLELK